MSEIEEATWGEVKKLLWQHDLVMLHGMFEDTEESEPNHTLFAIFNSTFMTYLDINPNDPSNVWLGIKTMPGVMMTLETYESELRSWHKYHSRMFLGKKSGMFSAIYYWLRHKTQGRRILSRSEGEHYRTAKLYLAAFLFIILIMLTVLYDVLPQAMRTAIFKLGGSIISFILGSP